MTREWMQRKANRLYDEAKRTLNPQEAEAKNAEADAIMGMIEEDEEMEDIEDLIAEDDDDIDYDDEEDDDWYDDYDDDDDDDFDDDDEDDDDLLNAA